jgi:hypothetical protein
MFPGDVCMLRPVLTLVLCALILGCESRTYTTVVVGGVGIGFDGESNEMKVKSDTAHVVVGSANYDISVQNNKLKINGREYGTIAKGDIVDLAGDKITINGHLATP